MNRIAQWKTVMVVAASALVLAACGSDGEGSGSDEGAAGDKPVSGGTLSFVQMSEPRILDPGVMAPSPSTNALVGNGLFGTLMIDKPDGSIEYSLAKSMETSDGGTTWKLTLRDGITFSDGSPMTAADVAYNWERLKEPTLGSQSISTANYLDELKPEGQVLTFTLTEPIAQFAYGITANSLNWIAKADALKAGQAEFDKNPIGAGPFTLKSWTRGGKMVLVKNPKYFDKPKPYLDELVLTANGDEGQRLETVKSGDADGAMTNDIARYKAGVDSGLKGITQGLNGANGVGMNFARPPFDDPRAREAVVKGMDRQTIVDAVYEGKGDVPKTFFTDDSIFANGVPLTPYDKAGAQKLFNELAAEGKPVEFTFTAFQASQSRRVGETIQAQLGAYDNVKVNLEVLDFPAATAKVQSKQFQMINTASPTFLDPEMVLYQHFHTGSAGNTTNISDPQMDEALEIGRTSSDQAERKAAYKTVAERLAALNPGFWYIRFLQGAIYQPYLGGVEQYAQGAILVDRIWTTKN